MAYFVVDYTYRADADLDAVRPRHREFLGALAEQGALIASGPLLDVEPPGAVLIFRAGSVDEVSAMLESDPFNEAGLIADVEVNGWNPVIGVFAD